MKKLHKAAEEFIARQNRTRHPVGHFDSAKRWYPSDSERQTCCGSLRSPSRRWSNGLNKHCRTLKHVALLMGVDQTKLKRFVADVTEVIKENEIEAEEMKKQAKRKKPVKKHSKCTPEDCNITRLKAIGEMAIEIAVEDYEGGDLAKDPFEQIGRALYAMQQSRNEEEKKCKPEQQLLS